MKIEIREDDRRICLSNDELDNDNFIDLTIYVDEGDMMEATVSVSELYTAVKAFYEKRSRDKDYDNKLN
jgi:hypothetical protein